MTEKEWLRAVQDNANGRPRTLAEIEAFIAERDRRGLRPTGRVRERFKPVSDEIAAIWADNRLAGRLKNIQF